MLEIWRKAGSFEGRSRVRTFMLGIAHHKVIDHFRRAGRYAYDELDEGAEDLDTPSPMFTASHGELREHVRICLDELSDVQRQVVHLAFFEELSYREISEIAQCPTGTVKTRMLYAKRALRECLERAGQGD